MGAAARTPPLPPSQRVGKKLASIITGFGLAAYGLIGPSRRGFAVQMCGPVRHRKDKTRIHLRERVGLHPPCVSEI